MSRLAVHQLGDDVPGFRKSKSDSSSPAAAGDGGHGRPDFSYSQILYLVKAEFDRARRHRYPSTCILLAPDRLEQRTDVHGEEFRQSVLAAVGRVVREQVRVSDHIGLVQGSRFLLVLPHTEVLDAERVAARICAAFAELEIAADGQAIQVTLSGGIAGASGDEPPLFETVLAQAEGALQRAAQEGDNVVVVTPERFQGPVDE